MIKFQYRCACNNEWSGDANQRVCPKCEAVVPASNRSFFAEDDPVEHPPHYTSHPSGVECIQITEHMGFNLGNAVKYIWRADLKGDAIQDLEKARFYINRELAKRKGA